ncbi:Sec-independent protein translocase subunit TatA [Actinomycetospora soli]|uniref:Sec-independent protein translocase subunit TatA n=1 Tax=Actinomycetospora soli TaxID=2893887 RepID=UPI001E5FDA73|nr:Sec-independent protein translocase subunit TatA [Actinomycetospora soli]MCD2186053.1 Sec-independent protein translocase subunit TatA [Actinomycetospora soli]
MGSLSPVHWAIVLVVVLLLFGSRKLPDMARGLGQSMRILKAESRAMAEDGRPAESGRTTGEGAVSSNATARPAAAPQDPPSAERHAS